MILQKYIFFSSLIRYWEYSSHRETVQLCLDRTEYNGYEITFVLPEMNLRADLKVWQKMQAPKLSVWDS